ncbi:hypothetical protein PF008_g17032 [Phytophthora fragariae]|uniref:DDE Tnp4 domain-containing protein n=1 Tax=Phytophthora fragariae TaxID=53985 RepID=A0A6G0RAT5_9STRA|nr:hypothetical protein PF008_g17032 [Phytophthora fragariae]
MKAGGTWEGLYKVFNIASATFTDTVTKFIRLLSPKLYADQVQAQADRTQMRTAMTSGHAFSNFPCALYAVDVTFQQRFCPGGPIQENGKYYSGKHHLYGLKVEVSVNTHGFAINCSDHAKGATHDVSMFKDNKPFHLGRMIKLPGDESLQDNGPISDKYPDQWAILADKGYQGMANYLRCIHPKKGKNLTRAELVNNDKISSDRVLVENYFGRLNMLWRVTADKFRWSEALYDDVFRLCVALTNYNISINPLRDQNGDWYRQSQHKLIQLGPAIKEKRRLQQAKYRAKKKRRLETSIEDLGGEDDANEDSLIQYSQEF